MPAPTKGPRLGGSPAQRVFALRKADDLRPRPDGPQDPPLQHGARILSEQEHSGALQIGHRSRLPGVEC